MIFRAPHGPCLIRCERTLNTTRVRSGYTQTSMTSIDRTPHEVLWCLQVPYGRSKECRYTFMGQRCHLSKLGLGRHRICCHDTYSRAISAQEDEKYYNTLIMTTTSRRTSPSTVLSQRRDHRSSLLRVHPCCTG